MLNNVGLLATETVILQSFSLIDQNLLFILDHADALRRVYTDVSKALEAQSVVRNVYQWGAITLKELQTIQSERKKPIKAAERLLNIVLAQSSNVYGYFLNALKTTGQKHVYEMVITGRYKGKISQVDRKVRYTMQCVLLFLYVCHLLTATAVTSDYQVKGGHSMFVRQFGMVF